MLLSCPVCDSRFRVSPQMLGDGRDVRCSKCGNMWYAMPSDAEGGSAAPARPREDMLPPSMAEDEYVPSDDARDAFAEAIATAEGRDDAFEEEPDIDLDAFDIAIAAQGAGPRRVQAPFHAGPWIAGVALLLALNLLAAMALMRDAVITAIPATAGLYAAVGYGPTLGLSLGDLEVKASGPGANRAFDIAGVVHNNGKAAQPFPPLEIDLVDKDGAVLRGWPMQTQDVIGPGKSAPFHNLPENKLTSALVEQATAMHFRLGTPGERALHD